MKILFTFLALFLFFTIIPSSFSENHNTSDGTLYEINIQPYSHYKSCEFLDNCFKPSSIEINAGDTVTWTNYDDSLHNIVHINEKNNDQPFFSSELLTLNEKFSFTFNSKGIFSYICSIHPWMYGNVFVDVPKTETKVVDSTQPIIFDDELVIEEYVSGLMVPVNMEFIDNDILVLEKNNGQVRHIKNNELLETPVLDLEVSNYGEQGLLGITSVENSVYLFLTEAYNDGGRALENRIYKYHWNGDQLVEPSLVKSIPGFEREYLGGELVSDLSGNVYAVTGENYKIGILQNHPRDESFRHFSSSASSDEKSRLTIFDSLDYLFSCSKISFYKYTTNPFGWQSDQPDFSDNPLESNIFQIS